MGKGKELTTGQHAMIVGMAKGGDTVTKIKDNLRPQRGTVLTVLRRYCQQGSIKTAKCTGLERPCQETIASW